MKIGRILTGAELKPATKDYLHYSMAWKQDERVLHPRHRLYYDLSHAVKEREKLIPPPQVRVGSFRQQLQEDGQRKELFDVTPELWQVVADCSE